MTILLLVACGSGGGTHVVGGETIDLVDGTYVGYPAEGDPAEGVRVRDADSTFAVRFYEHEGDLWAFVSFRGEMVVRALGLGIVLTAEDVTIEGVTVSGNDLSCAIELAGINFDVTGLFADERESLYLDVTDIGTLTLSRQGDGEDTGGDTGAG
jgi:hypothetical protein